MYGNKIGQSLYSDHVSVIGEIDPTPAGNVAIRIGSLTEGSTGWTQVEHVVLTSNEVADLVRALSDFLPKNYGETYFVRFDRKLAHEILSVLDKAGSNDATTDHYISFRKHLRDFVYSEGGQNEP